MKLALVLLLLSQVFLAVAIITSNSTGGAMTMAGFWLFATLMELFFGEAK